MSLISVLAHVASFAKYGLKAANLSEGFLATNLEAMRTNVGVGMEGAE